MEAITYTFTDRESQVILPLGDIQLDPKIRNRPRQADVERLKRVIDWGMEHDAVFLGMGDYVDVASPSNRAALRATRLYENVVDTLEEAAEQTQDELHEILAPTVGRWIGLLHGHHLWPYADGTTTDTRLAAFLETTYLGTSALIRCRFPSDDHKKQSMFDIWAHHGLGGGQLIGAPLNKLEHVLKAFEADVYLIGHHHKALAAKYPKLALEGGDRGGAPHLTHKDRILACTGSFLRGWLQGSRQGANPHGGYVEEGMMNPVALGAIAITARPRLKNGYAQVDLDYQSL